MRTPTIVFNQGQDWATSGANWCSSDGAHCVSPSTRRRKRRSDMIMSLQLRGELAIRESQSQSPRVMDMTQAVAGKM